MGLGHLGLMMIGLLFVGSFIFSSSFRGLFRRGAEIMSINDLEGRAFVGQHLAVGYGFSSLMWLMSRLPSRKYSQPCPRSA